MDNGEFYCIKNYSERESQSFFKKGNYYKYKKYGVHITIFDDYKRELIFNIYSYFGEYVLSKHFMTLKKYRKEKLKKICKTNIK